MSLEIVVDSNEAVAEPKVIKVLQSAGLPIKIKNLQAGDYFISPFLFERKTSSDFIRSIRDGALWRQLDAMKSAELLSPILLIEGSFAKALKFSKFSVRSIYGALWNIASTWKVQIVNTSNVFHTAVLFNVVYKSLSSEKQKKIYPVKVKHKALTLEEKRRAIVESYPSIGPVLALGILAHFGSIKCFVNASKDELLGVRGIGDKLSKEIFTINNCGEKDLQNLIME